MFETLEKNLYGVRDLKTGDYSHIVYCSGPEAKHMFSEFINDVTSPLYNSSDYDVCCFGNVDDYLYNNSSVVCPLTTLKDNKRIELQYMIQTLNYLPVGYFKMPSEMQEEYKKKIDEAVKKYTNYLVSNAEKIDEN